MLIYWNFSIVYMKSDKILESLINGAEVVGSSIGYSPATDLDFLYSVLKVNPSGKEDIDEIILYNDSDYTTYRKVHAYILEKGNDTLLYLFKNSVPSRIKYLSEGKDVDLFSQRLRTFLVASVKSMESNNSTINPLTSKVYRLLLPKGVFLDELYEDREYIVKNARKNKDGKSVCWHIYPQNDARGIILNMIEHVNPTTKMIINSQTAEWNEDTHYVPVEKDMDTWQNYIEK